MSRITRKTTSPSSSTLSGTLERMTYSRLAPISELQPCLFFRKESDVLLRSFEAGVIDFERYAHILTKNNPLFVRAAGSIRVVDSANNWTAGLSR
jgi:hypothetical protein